MKRNYLHSGNDNLKSISVKMSLEEKLYEMNMVYRLAKKLILENAEI